MLDLLAAILLAVFLGAEPAPYLQTHRTDTGHLAALIREQCPRCEYAHDLADAILTESLVRALEPTLMVAIAWTESNFERQLPVGRAGEVGIWQIIPGDWLGPCYDEIRGLTTSWGGLSLRARRSLLRNVRISTYLAACIVAYHLRTCPLHEARCYAAYQTGTPGTITARYRDAIRARAIRARRWIRGR